jgi:hypothetical protein
MQCVTVSRLTFFSLTSYGQGGWLNIFRLTLSETHKSQIKNRKSKMLNL